MTSGDTHGTSYIGSKSMDSYEYFVNNHEGETREVDTISPLNPRAPPPLSTAVLQTMHRAAFVNLISTPEQAKSAVYCETSEPLTSVRIRRRSAAVRGESVVTEGIRETNSGINLNVFIHKQWLPFR
jgi:hypothetical protein